MTVLVDTGVVYADHDMDATCHDTAASALEAVYDGGFGQPYISDYVFDESVTLTRTCTGSHAAATGLSDRLRGRDRYPRVYDLLYVTAAVFADSIEVFERYDDQDLSFTDATSVALIRRHDIDGILSYADDFDGIVARIDPETV